VPAPTLLGDDPWGHLADRAEVIEPSKAATAHAGSHPQGARVGVSTIERSFSAKRNSLNFLRLVLALAVVFSHSITLGMFGSEWILGKTTLGTVAVYGFFGISGYLIAGSAARNNAGRYLWQRFLRIFPAFWICLLVTAFLFGTIAWFHFSPGLSRTCGLHCYLTEPNGPFGYVRHNFWLQVNQTTITGTLPGGFLGYGWDASLWTLELEFLCYLLLAAFSVLGLLKRRSLVALIAAIAWIAEVVVISTPTLALNFNLNFFSNKWSLLTILGFRLETMKILVLVPIFLSGSLLYLYRDKVPDSGVLALGATVLVLAGLVIPVGQGTPLFLQTSFDLTAVFLAYPLIWLGIHLPFTRVGAVNDYSYGIYIYAFPIQQLLVMWGMNRWGYWPYALLSVAAVIPLAVASWWLIEKHALKLKGLKIPRPFRSDSTGKPTASL
jgi:peptidoglycan/LPS O-acetylase OafA/YrhL